jgi:hypothetical protein
MFKRFVSLPAARRRLLPVVLHVLSGVRLLLALMPFHSVRRAVARVRLPVGLASARAEDVAWAIDPAACGSAPSQRASRRR